MTDQRTPLTGARQLQPDRGHDDHRDTGDLGARGPRQLGRTVRNLERDRLSSFYGDNGDRGYQVGDFRDTEYRGGIQGKGGGAPMVLVEMRQRLTGRQGRANRRRVRDGMAAAYGISPAQVQAAATSSRGRPSKTKAEARQLVAPALATAADRAPGMVGLATLWALAYGVSERAITDLVAEGRRAR